MPEYDRHDDTEADVNHVNMTRKWLEENYKKCYRKESKCPVVMTDTCGIKAHTRFFCTDNNERKMLGCPEGPCNEKK